jgi:hypothetical protein
LAVVTNVGGCFAISDPFTAYAVDGAVVAYNYARFPNPFADEGNNSTPPWITPGIAPKITYYYGKGFSFSW